MLHFQRKVVVQQQPASRVRHPGQANPKNVVQKCANSKTLSATGKFNHMYACIPIPRTCLFVHAFFIFLFCFIRVCDDLNNNCGCNYDAGDCCGAEVDKSQCRFCECKDPAYSTCKELPVYGRNRNLATVSATALGNLSHIFFCFSWGLLLQDAFGATR